MRKKKMLSPKQFATAIGRPYTTVMSWLQSGQISGALKTETPTGHVWAIPEGTKPPVLKPGPKPAAKKAGGLKKGKAR
jgi:hypothetical protein